jgi:hypothetical protein
LNRESKTGILRLSINFDARRTASKSSREPSDPLEPVVITQESSGIFYARSAELRYASKIAISEADPHFQQGFESIEAAMDSSINDVEDCYNAHDPQSDDRPRSLIHLSCTSDH